MKKALVLTLAGLAFATLVTGLAAAPRSGAHAACTPGVQTIGGVKAQVFCGPAKATAHAGGKTYSFANGKCQKAFGAFAVNIGTKALGTSSKFSYFGLIVQGTHAGIYTGTKVLVGFNVGKLKVTLADASGIARPDTKVVIAGGLHSGTFSGRDISGKTVTGTFTC